MKVCEIFETIQGEGLYTGAITTFIRFMGCSLLCPKCDTAYAQKVASDSPEVGPPYIIDKMLDINPNVRHVCITGGEPLEQPARELDILLKSISLWHGSRNLESITIETNGARSIAAFVNQPYRRILSFSVDYKPPSTGKTQNMIVQNYMHLTNRDVIKFVCADDGDVDCAFGLIRMLADKNTCQAIMLFHADGGRPEQWLSKLILRKGTLFTNRFDIRLGVQLHKFYKVK